MGKKTGALLKEARTAAKLTQEQLAKKIPGVSASDISKAERGEMELTQTALKQIAKETGVTQSSLLNAEKPAAKTTKATEKSAAKSTSKTAKSAAKTSATKTSATKTSSAAKKTTSKAKSDDFELTAAEKKLVELYRKADADTKKAAVSLLKGEKNDIQQMLGGLFGDALNKFLK